MSIPGIQACSAARHDVASVCSWFLRETGLVGEPLTPLIRQSGCEREGDGGRLAGCYLLSVAAVFRMNGNCVHATPAIMATVLKYKSLIFRDIFQLLTLNSHSGISKLTLIIR